MEVPNSTTSSASFYEKFESKLTEYEQQHQGSQRKPWTAEKVLEVMNNIRKARVTMSSNHPKTAMDYYWLSKYDIMVIANEEFLIFKRKSPNDPTVRIIPRNEYFGILEEVHKSCGHGGRDKMTHAIKSKFYIPKKAIEIFLAHCPTCETKKHFPKKGIVTRPIVSQDLYIRGQVDLIDFQSCPDGEYKWLLNYQDNTTKFMSLRPLKTKREQEVATELLKIFMIFGAPYILQSNNGREFTAKIIVQITAMWPECKIVHGSSRGPQTQGSVEKSNQEVENMLRSWMYDNNSTNWALGCYHVQYKKNSSFHRIIGKSPYKAMFASDPKAGLSSSTIPSSILINIASEEQLQHLLEQESSSENHHVGAAIHAIEQNTNLDPNKESVEHLNRSILNQPECESDQAPNIKSEPQFYWSNDVIAQPDKFDGFSVPVEFKFIDYNQHTPSESEPCCSKELLSGPETIKNNLLAQQNTDKTKNHAETEELENLEPNFTCIVYHNTCTGAHTCSSCENFVHFICGSPDEENEGYGSKVLCILCKSEEDIQLQRNEAHRGTKRAAEKMLNNTAKKLPPLKIGEAVIISVPKVDRGPLDTQSIKGKIVDVRNGVYRVGNKTGILKNWFGRNDLQFTSEDFNDDIPDVPVSLKEAVSPQSLFSDQDFQRCVCKPAPKQCRTNRCACFKKNVLCGSKCHNRLSCVNK